MEFCLISRDRKPKFLWIIQVLFISLQTLRIQLAVMYLVGGRTFMLAQVALHGKTHMEAYEADMSLQYKKIKAIV